MSVNIEQVKFWVRENTKSLRSIDDVAGYWKCSAETLRKEFWRKEKCTLGEYITRMRVETAKRLLLETNLLCKEVCFEAGFRREDTGADIFKKVAGVTMTQFRAVHRSGKGIPSNSRAILQKAKTERNR